MRQDEGAGIIESIGRRGERKYLNLKGRFSGWIRRLNVDNNKFTISIEPKDKYEKARKDVIEAMKSFQDLTAFQQQQLVQVLLGYEGFTRLCSLINNL